VLLANKIQRMRVMHERRGDLSRLRVALCAVFAAHGFMFATWAVRVPAVKEQTAASSAALGLALLGLSAGAVATMLLAGALCRRFGSPRVTVLSCAVLSLTLPLPALARSALALGLLLAAFGSACSWPASPPTSGWHWQGSRRPASGWPTCSRRPSPGPADWPGPPAWR
jgi:MFS family permease